MQLQLSLNWADLEEAGLDAELIEAVDGQREMLKHLLHSTAHRCSSLSLLLGSLPFLLLPQDRPGHYRFGTSSRQMPHLQLGP